MLSLTHYINLCQHNFNDAFYTLSHPAQLPPYNLQSKDLAFTKPKKFLKCLVLVSSLDCFQRLAGHTRQC
jgi:hypothetical protein